MKPSLNKRNTLLLFSLIAVTFILLAIPLTVIVSLQSEQTARRPQAAATRDPLKQPFASWSIWNLPIGTGAVYKAANIKPWSAYGVFLEENYIFNNAPGSTLTDVVANNVGWDSGSRCPAQGGNIFGGVKLNLPSSFIIPDRDGNDTPNNASAILSPDGKKYYQTQPLTHCTNTSPWTALPYNHTIVDIDKDGIEGDQGGSGMSSVGGAIRVGEWKLARTLGRFPHALKTVLNDINYGRSAGPDCSAPGCRWPAVTSDCGGTACMDQGGYSGGTAQNHVKMGTLLAIHPTYNCTGMRTEPGRIVCQTLKDYGMYIVDSGWDPAYIPIEIGPAGDAASDFATEFPSLGGLKTGSTSGSWAQDWQQLITSTQVVDNWNKSLYDQVRVSNGALGAGGGTPRVAWAADLCTTSPCGGGTDNPPTVSITNPNNGSTITTTSVTITANASDDSGVSKVDFFIDGAVSPLCSDTTSPYTCNWNTSGLSGSHSIMARSVDTANQVSAPHTISVIVNLTPSTLPSPWVTSDIGTVGLAGSASYNSGIFTINGAGADIWGTTDSFRFVYQDLAGNGSIVARITSQTNTDPWAKSGVMIRETLSPDSKHAMMIVTPTNGVAFQYRTTTAGTTAPIGSTPGTAPLWVKITRSGSTLTGYTSTDGVNFTQIGTTTITMASTVKIGMVVLSHNTTVLGQAHFSNVTVSTDIGGKTGDMNSDGKVDVLDLSYLLSKWGTADSKADINKDGTVSVLDLSTLLANWG